MGIPQCKCKEEIITKNEKVINFDDVIWNNAYEEIEDNDIKKGQENEDINEEKEGCKTKAVTKNNTTDQKEQLVQNNDEQKCSEELTKNSINKEEEQPKEIVEENNPNEKSSISKGKEEKIENIHPLVNNNQELKEVKEVKGNKPNPHKNKIRQKSPNQTLKFTISEKKINSLGNNEVIFAGELQKMVNNVDKKSVSYSNRFCVLTKVFFSYYATKETFMTMKKPLCKLLLKYITKIEQEILNNNSLYFCIVFQLNEETSELMKQINSFSVVTSETSSNNNNEEEGMLGFKSDNKETIMKWVGLLNYLVNYKNEGL